LATAQKVGFHAPSATAQKSAFVLHHQPSSATSKKLAFMLYQQLPKKSAFMLYQ
jgi:hypothetical protein